MAEQADCPCFSYYCGRCINLICCVLLALPVWGIAAMVRGGPAYVGVLTIPIPIILIVIIFVISWRRIKKEDEKEEPEKEEPKVRISYTPQSFDDFEDRKLTEDALQIRELELDLARIAKKSAKDYNYYSNRERIYHDCLEKALLEIIEESEIGKEIKLKSLWKKVYDRAKLIHNALYPDYDPIFANVEERVEEMIKGNLELRNLIGYYDVEKKTFTPLTIEMLIEKEKSKSENS